MGVPYKMSIYFKKLNELRQLIKFHGGIKGSYKTLYNTDTLKIGTYKGSDVFGNRYYENRQFFIGRSRWVEFTDAVGHDYDGSQIPAEWRLWLAYTREETPVEKPPVDNLWAMKHVENKTMTESAYMPYSTTKTKVEAWKP